MTLAMTLFLTTLALSGAIQAWMVWRFVNCLAQPQRKLLSNDECQSALVVLCLRGKDPFLSQCIEGLLQQDYPCYRVVIVIDHPTDPAVPAVRQILSAQPFGHCEVEYLREPLMTCGLKCSSLIQVVANVPNDLHFIAQIDADTIPHRTWLRELATALQPEAVGAVSGNRWYMPSRLSLGALVRYTWNAAAVVQMYWYRIAWGGTLAIKVSAIRQAGLVERWRVALCEDTMLRGQLARVGLEVRFVPTLMMVNREDCRIGNFLPWVTRQLLTAKLYHPAWPAIAFHGLSSLTILIFGWGWACVSVLQAKWSTAVIVFLAMVAFQASLAALLPWLEHSVARQVTARNQETKWSSKLTLTKFYWGLMATQWFYSWSLIKCLMLKRVEWRGIEYQVEGPWHITMQRYQPYSTMQESPTENDHSL